MRDIFKLAKRVVVWTGTECDESTFALQLMTYSSSIIEVDWRTYTMQPPSAGIVKPSFTDRTKDLPRAEREFWALAPLSDRP